MDFSLPTHLTDLLGELGVPGVELKLASLGSLQARRAYLEELARQLKLEPSLKAELEALQREMAHAAAAPATRNRHME